tara:strand:- start:708 stop:908 length:201 start_codon:yes stop_codon:yes gene_type:complete
MPTVVFPYTKAGKAAARKAAKMHGGKVVPDKKADEGIGIMIAVGSPARKPTAKKSPAKKRKRSKKA